MRLEKLHCFEGKPDALIQFSSERVVLPIVSYQGRTRWVWSMFAWRTRSRYRTCFPYGMGQPLCSTEICTMSYNLESTALHRPDWGRRELRNGKYAHIFQTWAVVWLNCSASSPSPWYTAFSEVDLIQEYFFHPMVSMYLRTVLLIASGW